MCPTDPYHFDSSASMGKLGLEMQSAEGQDGGHQFQPQKLWCKMKINVNNQIV